MENNYGDFLDTSEGSDGSKIRSRTLTQAQKLVVNFPPKENTIMVVNAGPGTGKTSTLVRRIAALSETFDPSEILVLSMANRSVNAIRNSLPGLFETGKKHPDVFTFHSFCGIILDEYGELFSSRVLVDDFAWRNFSTIFLGKQMMDERDNPITAHSLERILYAVKTGSSIEKQACKYGVSVQYIELVLEYLAENKMMRYNDLLLSAMQILDEKKDISRLNHYKVVIVDEFQDMYPQLMDVVRSVVSYPTEGSTLAKKHLTIAGDPHQTIYEFLGSNPRMMTEIGTFLGMHVTEMSLGESFRCTPETLQVANGIGLGSCGLLSTTASRSTKPPGIKPILMNHMTAYDEYQFIASEITRLICLLGGLLVPSDFVILTRSNRELEEISQVFLQKYGYNCNRFSLSSSWVNSRVHILLDLLNLLNGGGGLNFALLCLLAPLDNRRFNSARISKLFRMSNQAGGSENLENYLRHELGNLNLDKVDHSITNIYKGEESKPFLDALKKLLDWTSRTREIVPTLTPILIIKSLLEIAQEVNLLEYLNKPDPTKRINDKRHRAQMENNLAGFYKSLCGCHKSYVNDPEVSVSFLEYFLRNYNDEPPILDKNMINISTVHTAKGLEFPVVFLAGVSEKHASFWSPIIEGEEPQVDSKARLFYVACTRAQSMLYTSALERIIPKNQALFRTSLPSGEEVIAAVSREPNRVAPLQGKVQDGIALYSEVVDLGLVTKVANQHMFQSCGVAQGHHNKQDNIHHAFPQLLHSFQQQRLYHTRAMARLTHRLVRCARR